MQASPAGQFVADCPPHWVQGATVVVQVPGGGGVTGDGDGTAGGEGVTGDGVGGLGEGTAGDGLAGGDGGGGLGGSVSGTPGPGCSRQHNVTTSTAEGGTPVVSQTKPQQKQ